MTQIAAGRELDALIAEKVMGLKVVATDWACGRDPECGAWGTEYRSREEWDSEPCTFYTEPHPVYLPDYGIWPANEGGLVIVHIVPFYSTDISAAWEVVAKIAARDDQPYFELRTCGQYFTAVFNVQHSEITGVSDGETAPLAICRAALNALEAR